MSSAMTIDELRDAVGRTTAWQEASTGDRAIAAALEVTERTVERQWAYARARLMQLVQEIA